MPKPVPIQLAIQGGGAKICYLMAALEAAQELQRAGVLAVKRIAGTSAGAIVGCLFAAGVSMEGFRKELVGGLGNKLKAQLQPPSKWGLCSALVRGTPFWDEGILKDEFDRIFKEKKIQKIGDTKANGIDLLIISSDLENGGVSIAKDSDFISNALLDSSGIPFCFRGWRSPKPSIVDGGICNNFPWELLKDREEKIAGITFAPARPRFDQDGKFYSKAARFAKSLLDSSMDYAMEQTKSGLGPQSKFLIEPAFSTFDFDAALTYLSSENYHHLREKATKFFTDFVTDKPSSIVIKWDEENLAMMTKLGQIYTVQHKKNNIDFKHCSAEVQANCLIEELKPDVVTYSMTFHTMADPVHCLGIGLPGDPREPLDETRTSWQITHPDSASIEIIGLPMKAQHPGERELLLFFSPVLQPGTGPYTLIFQDIVPAGMADLRKTGKDEIGFVPARAGCDIPRIDLVIYVPKGFGKVMMKKKDEKARGRQMTGSELDKYGNVFGFNKFGWTDTDLPRDKEFSALVVVPL